MSSSEGFCSCETNCYDQSPHSQRSKKTLNQGLDFISPLQRKRGDTARELLDILQGVDNFRCSLPLYTPSPSKWYENIRVWLILSFTLHIYLSGTSQRLWLCRLLASGSSPSLSPWKLNTARGIFSPGLPRLLSFRRTQVRERWRKIQIYKDLSSLVLHWANNTCLSSSHMCQVIAVS